MTKTKRLAPGPNDHPLVALCKRHGNDAQDIRDAAHEAFHALYVDAQDWDREKVHRQLIRKIGRPSFLWVHELKARAVEQLVSAHYNHECGPLSGWIHNSIMEALKNRLPYADYDLSLKYATDAMAKPEIQRWAQRIIAAAQSESENVSDSKHL